MNSISPRDASLRESVGLRPSPIRESPLEESGNQRLNGRQGDDTAGQPFRHVAPNPNSKAKPAYYATYDAQYHWLMFQQLDHTYMLGS